MKTINDQAIQRKLEARQFPLPVYSHNKARMACAVGPTDFPPFAQRDIYFYESPLYG